MIFYKELDMEIKILEETKDKISIEIVGETHTLCNAIRNELWKDSHVKIAGYRVDHPLIANPILVVETDGKESPKIALKNAIDSMGKWTEQLQTKIKKLK